MNELVETQDIKKLIYTIRGKEVMLDSDLAILYQCKNGTKEINQAVKNNVKKFPERFSWILTDKEYENLRSKFLTSSLDNYGGRRYNPRVFNEQGVAMLATILKSSVATEVSIAIMDAFVAMRHFIIENKDIYQSLNNINNKLIEHDLKFEEVFSYFKKEPKELLYLNGNIYDAYSKIIDIMKEAKNELIIIDNYADKSVLDMISKLNVNVMLIVKSNSLLTKIDIQKYNAQYHNLKIIYNDTFHDRYLIIDKKEIYHCGTSLNKAGNKTFSINKLEEVEVIKVLINKVNKII